MISVLYIDDEPDLLDLCKIFLEQTGNFRVETVQFPREVLEKLARNRYDAIICDYQMPEFDGISILKQVRESAGEIPFILFTGRGREEIVIEALNNGADFYLQKGGDVRAQFAELASKVRQAVIRRQAERSLRESEKLLTDIINFLPDATLAIDRQGTVIAWNRAIEDLTGIPAGDMLGKGNYEYAIPFYSVRRPILIDLIFETDEKIKENYAGIIRDKDVLIAETSLPRPKGVPLTLMGKASPLYNQAGEIAGAIESIRDITAQKQADDELRAAYEQITATDEELRGQYEELVTQERRLQESEIKFRTLADASNAALLVFRQKILYANPAAEALTGYTEEELSRMDFWEIVHPDYQDRIRDSGLERQHGHAPPSHDEYRIVRKDNTIRWVDSSTTVFPYEGQITSLSIYLDITERKSAEEELFKSRQMLQLVLDHIPQRVFWKDRNSTFLGCNKAFASDTGYPDPQELRGKTDYEIVSPENADSYRRDDSLVMESGEPKIRYEEEQVRRDGSRAWLLINRIPLRDVMGGVIGVLGTYEDITEQKRVETELRAAYEQLTASDEELRGQFEELARADADIRKRDRQFQEITTTIPGVVYQFYARSEGEFGFYFISERSRDIFGIDNNLSEFFDSFTSHVHPDDRRAFLDSIDDVVKRSEKWHFEGRFIKPSGEMIWFKGLSSPSRHGNELVYSGVLLDISQRKFTEAALREEEAKYRTLVEHSQDAVFIVQDERLVFANRALSDMSGYAVTDLIGRPIGELIAPEDRDMTVSMNRDRMSGKPSPESYEFSLLHADQATRVTVKMNAGIANYQGKPATIGTFHNITRERKRDEALRQSEQKYRELAELLPQMVFEMDPDMRITYANRHALTSIGITKDEVAKGINAISFIDPSQHDMIMKNIEKIIRGEPYESPEYTAIRRDGSKFTVLIYASPVFQEKKLTGFRGVIVDISAWKTTSTALKESEERYRTLAEAAQDLIYIIDSSDNVAYVNNFGIQMLGKRGEEIIGRPRSELFPEPVSKKQYKSLQHVLTTGVPLRVESMVPLPGRNTWQDTHLVPLRAPDGTITAVLGISRDISQLKHADLALKRSNEKLNLLNSITRHDVANQLTVLQGYLQLATMKKPDMMMGDFLKKIERAANTIQRQIEFTRTYQDLGVRAPTWFRLGMVLSKTRPETIRFTNNCPDIEIFADPMLEKVFFNLFDNAIRHGERVSQITIHCEQRDDDLDIFFEDNGAGIPLDLKQKIFEKGFGKNTGYGLFLVREILAITNITIHETGKYGTGARFEITVPKGGFRINREENHHNTT